MTGRHYLRPIADLREELAELVGLLGPENRDLEVQALGSALIDELADFRGLLSQHVDVGGRRVYVKLGPTGRIGFEVSPIP